MSEDFGEIENLLKRYKTLRDANEDLARKQQRTEELNEEKRAEFNNYVKERTNEILNFNNEIASLQKKLEQAEAKRLRVQTEVDHSIRTASDKTLELGQILMAVSNLLQRCTCQHHGVNIKHRRKKGEEELAAKSVDELVAKCRHAMSDLQVIKSYIIDFEFIWRTFLLMNMLHAWISRAPSPNSGRPSTSCQCHLTT